MDAFLIVDFQNDFLPGGTLAVGGADQLAPVINELMDRFALVIASQDWHPQGHVSFSSSHQGEKPQRDLWPEHCLQGSKGAALSSLLHQEKIQKIFRKGSFLTEDSYSVFFNDAEKKVSTGLHEFLKNHQVKKIFIAGLVLEYCVGSTALDAVALGYEVAIFEKGVASLLSKKEIKSFITHLKKNHISFV